MSRITYEQAVLRACERDPAVVVLTAENRAAIRSVPAALGDRFVDFGICEQTMIGAAAGLALRGRKPIAHALATFLTLRAFEFIRTDLGVGRLPAILVGGVPGFLSTANGPTHQAIEDVAIMRGVPGMNVYCPSDEDELVRALPALLESGSAWYVRHAMLPPATDLPRAPFVAGRAEVVALGRHATLLVSGFLLREALAARDLLAKDGIQVGVVDVRTPKPFDEEVLVAAARATDLVVTIEDHLLTGGLASVVAEVVARRRLSTRLLPIALEERWYRPGLLRDVLAHERFDAAGLAARVRAAL